MLEGLLVNALWVLTIKELHLESVEICMLVDKVLEWLFDGYIFAGSQASLLCKGGARMPLPLCIAVADQTQCIPQ